MMLLDRQLSTLLLSNHTEVNTWCSPVCPSVLVATPKTAAAIEQRHKCTLSRSSRCFDSLLCLGETSNYTYSTFPPKEMNAMCCSDLGTLQWLAVSLQLTEYSPVVSTRNWEQASPVLAEQLYKTPGSVTPLGCH